MSDYLLKPIGYITAREGEFTLHIDAPYRAALKGLSEFSHVIVFWWAHGLDNPEDRMVLQTPLPYAPGLEAGVFASRSPARPNPIAITTMPHMGIDEAAGTVSLPWIDAEDGTPLIDLKPYIPISDRIRDVRMASWLKDWPMWMEDAGEFFATHEVDLGS